MLSMSPSSTAMPINADRNDFATDHEICLLIGHFHSNIVQRVLCHRAKYVRLH